MTRQIIFTVGGDGRATAMRAAPAKSEDFMQQIVALNPDIIAEDDGPLLLVSREQRVADREDGGGRWSIDHLFLTRSGTPVLVELKRATDTRLRREVVGQMMDYAANASLYWKIDAMQASFAETANGEGRDPDLMLADFLGDDGLSSEFWDKVGSNLRDGRMKLVFVADVIPRELATIVEFLNEQMTAEVRAVELGWFESGTGMTALAPRVIGATARTEAAKQSRASVPSISPDAWIEKYLAPSGPGLVAAGAAFLQIVTSAGGRAFVTSTQASIGAILEVGESKLYVMFFTHSGGGQVRLALKWLVKRAAFAPEEVRAALRDQLEQVAGPLKGESLAGFASFPAERLNEPRVQSGVADLLSRIRSIAAAGGSQGYSSNP